MFWLCVCNSFFVSRSVPSVVNICQFSGQPNFVVCLFHLFSLIICVLCCNFCCSGSSILLPESKIQNLFLEAFCIAHALDIVNYVDKCEGTVVWMDRVMGEFSQENIQCGQKNMVIREFTSKENSSIANLFISQNEPPEPWLAETSHSVLSVIYWFILLLPAALTLGYCLISLCCSLHKNSGKFLIFPGSFWEEERSSTCCWDFNLICETAIYTAARIWWYRLQSLTA